MRVYVESLLACNCDKAWREVRKSALLQEVAWPLVAIRPAAGEQFPEVWQAGATLRCRSYLFGFIPLGTRLLTFERIDDATHEIQTHESDALVRRWDHLISVQPAENDQTRYSDEIEIDAGVLTWLVWGFASLSYRHRQRRWRGVARRLARE